MKKILLIVLVICLSVISCNTNVTTNAGGSYNSEFADYAKQFNFLESIDTINLVQVNAKTFQVIDENSCLANELTNKEYGWYHGNIVYILTDALLYDNLVFNDKFILLGTYHYVSMDTTFRTVKAYVSEHFYKTNIEFFDKIKEICED